MEKKSCCMGISLGNPGYVSLYVCGLDENGRGGEVLLEVEDVPTAISYHRTEGVFFIGKDAQGHAEETDWVLQEDLLEHIMEGRGGEYLPDGQKNILEAGQDFLLSLLDLRYAKLKGHRIRNIVVALPEAWAANENVERRLEDLWSILWRDFGLDPSETGRVQYRSIYDVVEHDRIRHAYSVLILKHSCAEVKATLICREKEIEREFSRKTGSPPYSWPFAEISAADFRQKAANYYAALDPVSGESYLDAVLRTKEGGIAERGGTGLFVSDVVKFFEEMDHGATRALLQEVRQYSDELGIQWNHDSIRILTDPIRAVLLEHAVRLAYCSLDHLGDDRIEIIDCSRYVCAYAAEHVAEGIRDFPVRYSPYRVSFLFYDPYSHSDREFPVIDSDCDLLFYSKPDFLWRNYRVTADRICRVRIRFLHVKNGQEFQLDFSESFDVLFPNRSSLTQYNPSLIIDRDFCLNLCIKNESWDPDKNTKEEYITSLMPHMARAGIEWNIPKETNGY